MPLAGDAPSYIYVPDLGALGSSLTLSREEQHYLARVCRARAGETVTATDGRGTLARLRLTSLEPARAEVEWLERMERGSQAQVWCGAPEGERGDWLVEKLAELGIAWFQPLDCGFNFCDGAHVHENIIPACREQAALISIRCSQDLRLSSRLLPVSSRRR